MRNWLASSSDDLPARTPYMNENPWHGPSDYKKLSNFKGQFYSSTTNKEEQIEFESGCRENDPGNEATVRGMISSILTKSDAQTISSC